MILSTFVSRYTAVPAASSLVLDMSLLLLPSSLQSRSVFVAEYAECRRSEREGHVATSAYTMWTS